MSIYIEDALPVVKLNGLNTAKPVDFSGAASAALPAGTTIGGQSVVALGTITSTSATAFSVGRQGATNPVLNIDASTASVVTGLNIVGAASGSGAALVVTSSATNESLTIDAKGSGTVTINGTATGGVTLGTATTITTGDFTVTNGNIIVTANAKGLSFTGTGTNGGVLTNLYNTAASTLSGTQRDIKILIGTVPYWLTVYPSKA